jgi:predicted DNA-binding transcriptional regulator AlpA
MADTGTNASDNYYTVEYAAHLTGRSTEMLYRYIRQGIIETIPDPEDGRMRLIPWQELIKVLNQRKRGLRTKSVTLTLSDGSTIQRVAAVPK